VPVVQLALADARNVTTVAISSGSPKRQRIERAGVDRLSDRAGIARDHGDLGETCNMAVARKARAASAM
jgi:hypothetical protein